MPKITKNALEPKIVKELPIYCLRLEIQCIINHFADIYQCPREFIVSAVFALVSSACGKRLTILDGKYSNHPNLWICHVADSGCNKSSPLKKLLNPLLDENGRRFDEFKTRYKEYKNSSDMEEPTLVQLIVSDVTPEGLFKVMDDKATQMEGLLLYRDEIRGFIDEMARYNSSGAVSSYLSIWDGTSISITRKTQMPIYIQEPFLSIIGGIQPEIIQQCFTQEMADIGFTQRWLFVYPDVVTMQEYSENSINDYCLESWEETITKVLHMDDMVLTLSPEAKKAYIDYYNETGHKWGTVDRFYKSMLAKLRINVLKWCAITHLLSNHECAEQSQYYVLPKTTVISLEEMEYSIECMRYFEYCGSKVLGELNQAKKSPQTVMTQKEALITLVKLNGKGKINIQKLADGLGVSRQYVSKVLNSDPELRSCGCDASKPNSVSDNYSTSVPQPQRVNLGYLNHEDI